MTSSQMQSREWTLWVVAVSCLLHVLEEYLTGWQEWAMATLGIVMPTPQFLVANAVLVASAFALAGVGWKHPTLSLVIPAATLVNAIFFHIAPTLVQRRVSPGVFTATLLYLPFSSWAFVGAWRDGVTKRALLAGFVGGTVLMLSVALIARGLSSTRSFNQPATEASVTFLTALRWSTTGFSAMRIDNLGSV